MFSTTVPKPSDSAVVRATAARRWSSSSSVRTSRVTSSRPRSRVNAEMCWGCTGSGGGAGLAPTHCVTAGRRNPARNGGYAAKCERTRVRCLRREVGALPRALRRVHRLVGGAEQGLGLAPVARVDGDAEAGAQILEPGVGAVAQPGRDAVDDRAHLGLVRLREEQGEL